MRIALKAFDCEQKSRNMIIHIRILILLNNDDCYNQHKKEIIEA